MTDDSNGGGGGAGGMMKKLLFPASVSGANDTFKAPAATANTPTGPMTSSRKSPPIYAAAAAAHGSTSNKQSAPPRFFSSTHPSSSSSSSLMSGEKSSPEQLPLQTPARVPASPPRLNRQPVTPSSEMAAKAAVVANHTEDHQQRTFYSPLSSRAVDISSKPAQEQEDKVQQHATGDDSGNSKDINNSQNSISAQHAQSSPTKPSTQLNDDEDDDSLTFLKQFKEKRRQQNNTVATTSSSPPSSSKSPEYYDAAEEQEEEEEAKTEVHDNTTASYTTQQLLKLQQQERVVAAATRIVEQHATISERNSNETDSSSSSGGVSPGSDGVQGPAAADSGGQERQTSHELDPSFGPETTSNTLMNNDTNDDDNTGGSSNEEEAGLSPHDNIIQSYPSYYDNPYHNPLVASAMKPNDLFRKEQGNDISQDDLGSDVDSNASEFGTVIGAPKSLLADRFAEVDAMEREGNLAMQEDDDGGALFDLEEDGADHHHDDDIDDILEEEDDPALANYTPFRVKDDDEDDHQSNDTDDHETEDSFTRDPFQSPSAAVASSSAVLQQTHEHEENSATDAQAASSGKPDVDGKNGDEETHAEDLDSPKRLGQLSSDDLRNMDARSALHVPIRDTIADDATSSVVDSEIDQLVRRSASESSGGSAAGPVKSCSSNNSAEVFRAPSTGSVQERMTQHAKPPIGHHRQMSTPPSSAAAVGRAINSRLSNETDREDEELQAINSARSRDSSTFSSAERRKKRPDSSLQRALSGAQQKDQDEAEGEGESPRKDPGHGLQKEDEKEEKEDDLSVQQQQYHFEVPKDENYDEFSEVFTAVDSSHHASTGNPGTDLVNHLRRIGTKLAPRSPPRASKNCDAGNQYFFDIDDEEDESDKHHFESKYHGTTVSAPTTPRRQRQDNEEQRQHHHHSSSHYMLAKIQEAFPQSPERGSASSSQVEHPTNAPASFLLRSPGSSARLMADFRRESGSSSGSGGTGGTGGVESQRFLDVPSILKSMSSSSLGNGPTPRAKGGRQTRDQGAFRSAKTHPLRFARGCLSFDTTMDNHYDYDDKREKALFRATSTSGPDERQWLRPTQSYDVSQHSLASPSRSSTSAFRQRFKGISEKITGKNGQTKALYGSSRSWDFSSGKASSMWSATVGTGESIKDSDDNSGPAAVNLDASAFRVAPYVRQQNQHQHPHAHGYNNSNGSRLVSGDRRERLRLMSESYVPPGQHISGINRQRKENLELLQTPQRIEIEREDALNLLACLCERGVALHSQESVSEDKGESFSGGSSGSQGPSPAESPADEGTDNNTHSKPPGDADSKRSLRGDLEPETVDCVVGVLRELSKEQGINKVTDSVPRAPDHSLRMQVLDELLRSHTYALEMKRASKSASAWLRSIGHTDVKVADDGNHNTEAGQVAGEREASTKSEPGATTSATTVDVLAMKAMLHQAQIEAREKDAAARQLNEELSKCRAEIGRLLSVSRTKTNFTSPNRSILDDDDDESTVSAAGRDNTGKTEQAEEPVRNDSNIADESMVGLDSSFFGNEDTAEVLRESDQPLVRELSMFKSALSDANSIIKKLHSELQEVKHADEACVQEAPVIEVSEKAFSVALADESTSHVERNSNSFSDQYPENRTVNVRMLDGENFVTEWDSVESLPPPPDHGLRAPIVSALLQQWSTDEALHGSLMSWMDKAISGADPANIPPLTLSSLDHQVRDGFTMHVLPLLLRRPDILVDVTTRAHRTTTYDIAVSVMSNHRTSALPVRVPRRMESTPDSVSAINSVTHSAVTAHVQNVHADEKDGYEVGNTAAGYSTLLPHRSSDDKSEDTQQQGGLMGALGGAIGGLLSRRKPNSSSYYDAGIPAADNSYDMGSAVGAAGPGPMDFPPPTPQRVGVEQQHDPNEPYHRLVSAPPGRIGVSFVEYRGHAMVSDVSEDSPLLGWIFPSDVLIAIDEVPVSGMRLKEIVKVLQGRGERQRAMRVISSHAMNEFTMSQSTPS